MAKVPITVMGFKCDRCGHEWVPRDSENEPRVCPKCKSPWWNRPRKPRMSYEDFRGRVKAALADAGRPMTWTEIRTQTGLSQMFPNNQWVRRLEKDIGLRRERDKKHIVQWSLE